MFYSTNTNEDISESTFWVNQGCIDSLIHFLYPGFFDQNDPFRGDPIGSFDINGAKSNDRYLALRDGEWKDNPGPSDYWYGMKRVCQCKAGNK